MRRHFGVILGALALLSLVLGVVGFRACDATTTLATALYRSVQLFYWNYFPWNTTLEVTLPWTLELARWLAPLTTLGALSRVALALFQKRWDGWRVGRWRGHVVVCGAGEKGASLVEDLRGSKVVIVERDAARAEVLRAKGWLVIHGDATQPDVLRRAGVPHAAKLVSAAGDDHDNLAIALAAAALAEESLTIHAHTGSAALGDLYQRHQALAAVRFFNHFRNVARRTLADFPPESAGGEAHIVLPDLGRLGSALAVEYALLGHFTNERRVHLHVVAPSAEEAVAALRRRHPGIVHCAHLHAVELPSPGDFARAVAVLVPDVSATVTIFPHLAHEQEAFARALAVLELTRGRAAVRCVLPAAPDSPLRGVFITENPELRERLAFLPALASTCGREAIFTEALDRTARAIHENWLAETRRQIDDAHAGGDEALARAHAAKATFRPWDKLSDEQKGASRSQADHIAGKLRAVGLDPKTATPADWARLSPEQIETLARMEHARWAAYLWMTGWTYAAARDDTRRQHPNLVPYDELDEPTKDYDRAAVRKLGDYLSR